MSIFDVQKPNPMPELLPSQTILPTAAICQIESNSLTELNVPSLVLHKNEKCRFVDKCYRINETQMTRNIRKSCGMSMPSLFFKGVRYHSGSSYTSPVTEVQMQYIPGYLYITDRRILFTAKQCSMDKTLKSLSNYIPYSNAIGMQFGSTVVNFILPRPDLASKTLQIVTRI